ncbi:hypothetical protein [Methylomonas sp. DH-1]|uniref:hypothetical protein n=1 Tax=Methylomonas sp. (strain DH-1) TaxID=1727196 RepID=UPI0007C89198|nr:hypothetical protein [Methylomonas sp. DH-1]ANE56743.1 hypothetical protein AYM39_17215 [Methylomonas sp. DH-1]
MILMSGLGPTAEILFFAPPKKSIQKKGGPDAALILRSEGFDEGFRKGFPSPPKTSGIPAAPLRATLAKSSGVRRGKTGENRREINDSWVILG